MYYVSRAKSGNEVYVTDTKDNVEERYTYEQLKEICDTSCIDILGFRQNKNDSEKYTIGKCKPLTNGVLIESSRINNIISFYNVNGLSDKVNFDSIHDARNDVHLDGSFSVLDKFNSKRGYTLLSVNAWVKYDIEFCGKVFILIAPQGGVVDRTDLLFINNGSYSDEELEDFCGDYPSFITSSEVPISLKKGIFKGLTY